MDEPSLNFVRHGLRPTSKLVIFVLLSIALLMLDNRYSAIQAARSQISAVLYPLQWIAKQPVQWTQNTWAYFGKQSDLLHSEAQLQQENARLHLQIRQQQKQIEDLGSLKKLAALQKAAPANAQIAQIVSTGLRPVSERFIINLGSRNHVRPGDPVSDEYGLVGQVASVQPFSAEVMLATSAQTVIPAMVLRTGVRTLVYGRVGGLDLRYFPTDTDLRPGDLLITSGMDSIYPAGIPIANVQSVQKINGSPYYKVQLAPVAHLASSRFVMVIPQKTAPATQQPATLPAAKP